tara:strand:+ start:153 stop:533 length:381 start_codon:yes stop_codon:yes gene_type:complete
MIGRALVVQMEDFLKDPYEHLSLSESCKALLFKDYDQKDGIGVISHGVLDTISINGINIIGVDALSIDSRENEDLPNHRSILQRGIWIVEGLVLAEVDVGIYEYVIAPLKIQVRDGAPVRALLIGD